MWKEKHTQRVIELKELGYKWQDIADDISEMLDERVSIERCRHYYRYYTGTKSKTHHEVKERQRKSVTFEHKPDGNIVSERVIEATEEELQSPEFILKAHKLDPNKWKIHRHRTGYWEQNSNKDGKIKLHQSRLEVAPLGNDVQLDELIKLITADTKRLKLNTAKYKVKDKRALNIFFSDLHFGINTLEDYQDVIESTVELLHSNIWEEVIIPFGSDMLHVDNLNLTTANQTRMNDVSIPDMIENAKQFYTTIIDGAVKQSNKVTVLYIGGNHDVSTSYLLSHWLDAHYKEVSKVSVCKEIEEIKVHMFDNVFMAFTHGDKGGKRKVSTLASQYPKEWAIADVREIYTGHLHYEQAVDENGITHRILPTKAKTDEWHKKNSFVGAHKRFQIFEYTSNKLDKIHYV